MEGSRFDTWTRRSVGLLAGGLAGPLSGLAGHIGTSAKKEKKEKMLPARSGLMQRLERMLRQARFDLQR